MAKTKISQFDATASNNTDINSVNVAEGCPPSGINNAIREMASLLKKQEVGTDAMTSPDINGGTIDGATIGASSASTGAFTTISASGNTDLNGTLNVQGETTLQTHLNMGDNDKIKLGASGDLEIYHDGSNSYIADEGTGGIIISGGTVTFQNQARDETHATMTVNGSVDLYHNNVKKVETTSTGVSVTGLVKTSNAYQVWLGANVLGSTGGLTSIGANPIVIGTDGTERMRIDSSGAVGIGNSVMSSMSTDSNNLVVGSGSGNEGITIFSAHNGSGNIYFADGSSGGTRYRGWIEYYHAEDRTSFGTAEAERMRIDGSGNVFVGTTSQIQGGKLSVLGNIGFGTSTSKNLIGDFGSTDLYIINYNSGTMRFHVGGGSAGAERMRIESNGEVGIGTTNARAQLEVSSPNLASTRDALRLKNQVTNTGGNFIRFENSTGGVAGEVEQTGQTSVAYRTTSDYRIKENVSYDFDATARLKQLKAARFNFITEPDTTIDGFIAHEVQSVVPEAVGGTKDAVEVWKSGEELPDGVSVGDNKLDDDGNTIPKYQGIDHSLLVPLLVKTIQELEARITALENGE